MDHMSMGSTSTTTSTKPEHGTWEGHILPGSFFLIWSVWWFCGNFRLYFNSKGKKPFRARSWYEFTALGSKLIPLEPYLKVILPFIGINAELWAGHVSYRRMYDPATGLFEQGNIQDWQHSGMYAAFMISGLVDLAGYYTPPGTLPLGTEHAFLGLAFLIEGTLFGFHLKGTALDMKLHFILVLVVLINACACFVEIAAPSNFIITTMRAQATMLQGLWFYQIAQILFTENPAWDPNLHASVMMAPFFFVLWIMFVAGATFLVFLGVSLYMQRVKNYRPVLKEEDSWQVANGHGTERV